MKKKILILLLLCSTTLALSRPESKPVQTGYQKPIGSDGISKPVSIRRYPIPAEFIIWAWQDIQTVPFHLRSRIRYAWLDDDPRTLKSSSGVLNYLSRASIIYRPEPTAQGWMIRIDLWRLSRKEQDFEELRNIWELLAFDPSTSTLLTEDVLKDKVAVVRLDADHIPFAEFQLLKQATRSLAPVIDIQYLKWRSGSSIKRINKANDKGKVYETIFGGLYYEFVGIKKAKKGTDLDLYLQGFGILDNFEKLFDDLGSDQRLFIMKSLITGKIRDVSSFHTPAGKEGGTWGAITGDPGDEDIDIGDIAYANLLNPRRKAREAIFYKPSGFPKFALFNGNDNSLQDEVPPDVAQDHTIPKPYTQRFGSGWRCLICHGTDGSDGLKPLHNDAKILLALSSPLDVFGEHNRSKKNEDVIRVAELYTGDFKKNLRRARDDLAEATIKATGPWKESLDQTDVCKIFAKKVEQELIDYWYTPIDAVQALKELGLLVPKDRALDILRAILPPDLRSANAIFVPEDPRIAALLSGLSISRTDWSLAYSFAMERATRSPIWRKLRQ